MQPLKSFMDCPVEIISMILDLSDQPTVHSLMHVNKALLDQASVVWYSRLVVNETNLESFLRSYQASRASKVKGVCREKWKERMGLVKKVSVQYEVFRTTDAIVAVKQEEEQGDGPNVLNTTEETASTSASPLVGLINALPPDIILPKLESLVVRYDRPQSMPLDDMLALESRFCAPTVCDWTQSVKVGIEDEAFSHSDASDDGDEDRLVEVLSKQRPRMLDIVTIHQFDFTSNLWRHPGKTTRLCFCYHLSPTSIDGFVEEAVSHLAQVIQTVEDAQSPYHRICPIRWEIYQNDLDQLGLAFGVAGEREEGVSMDAWMDQQIQLAEIDQAIARKLEAELVRRCPMIKKRVKVMSFVETDGMMCDRCGKSMNCDAKH